MAKKEIEHSSNLHKMKTPQSGISEGFLLVNRDKK